MFVCGNTWFRYWHIAQWDTAHAFDAIEIIADISVEMYFKSRLQTRLSIQFIRIEQSYEKKYSASVRLVPHRPSKLDTCIIWFRPKTNLGTSVFKQAPLYAVLQGDHKWRDSLRTFLNELTIWSAWTENLSSGLSDKWRQRSAHVTRDINVCSMAAKTLIRLRECECAIWSEHSLSVYVMKQTFLRHGLAQLTWVLNSPQTKS